MVVAAVHILHMRGTETVVLYSPLNLVDSAVAVVVAVVGSIAVVAVAAAVVVVVEASSHY